MILSSEGDGQGNQHRSNADHGKAGGDRTQARITREHVAGAEEQRDGDGI